MTRRRLLRSLGAVAAALTVLCLIYLSRLIPRDQSPYKNAEKKASSVRILQGAESVMLSRQGESWRVDLGTATPAAQPERVQTLLRNLEAIRLEDVISYQADRAGDFEVTETSGTRLTVRRADGQVLADGIVGKQAPDYVHFYFRYADRPDVYLASGLSRAELAPGAPRDWVIVSTATAR